MTALLQAQKIFKLLNYDQSDRICLRAIANNQAKSLTATLDKLPIETLKRLNQQKYGIYFVPNGGHGDSEISHCRAIFIEHDNIPKEQQCILWSELNLPEPSFQIFTGGKSIHNYWSFDQSIPVAEWLTLQSDLIAYTHADKANCNPSRLMRLAGFIHQKTGQPSLVIGDAGHHYSFQTLRSAIPTQQKKTKKRQDPIPGQMPLSVILAKNNRDLIAAGVAEGERNNLGYQVACDLIGAEALVIVLGQPITEPAQDLFEQFCDRCRPPLGDKEREAIWKSAIGTDPSPCLSLDKIQNCIDSWKDRASKTSHDFHVNQSEIAANEPQTAKNPKVTFLQKAEHELYSDKDWISFSDTLYSWENTHYQAHSDESEYPRIKAFAQNFAVKKTTRDGEKMIIYPFAKPSQVKQVLEWVKQGCSVGAEKVNPPGVNCTNGVLELHWKGKNLFPKLIKHDPKKHLFLGQPQVTYNPHADPKEYNRLLECLDPGPREIWERTVATALDIETIRKFKGRLVKALFLKGDGANGKDALRLITQGVMGVGVIASCSATDWKQYDQGRYFPIYTLRGKRINWPSENADVGRVDMLRGLRAAITGDPITFEPKNKMGVQEPCKAVFIFNCNEIPNIIAQLKATSSRWGIIPFNKTYSVNPGPGELQADPRFKEDPDFIREEILSACLNRLLEQLQNVVNEGIDYSCTQAIFEELQRENSHLLQFAHDTGLVYSPGSQVTVKEIWQRLRQWYVDTGTLEIEENSTVRGGRKEKLTWNDQPRKGDKNVKASNQIVRRFLEIFPKAKKGTATACDKHNKIIVLIGLKFLNEKSQKIGHGDHGTDNHDTSNQVIEVDTTSMPNLKNGHSLGMEPCPIDHGVQTYPMVSIPNTIPNSGKSAPLEPLENKDFHGHHGHHAQKFNLFNLKTSHTTKNNNSNGCSTKPIEEGEIGEDDIDWHT